MRGRSSKLPVVDIIVPCKMSEIIKWTSRGIIIIIIVVIVVGIVVE